MPLMHPNLEFPLIFPLILNKSSLDNCKVYVKDFPGARARCMQDYVRPTLRENPDHIIIHIGTNDLASNTPAEKVAESIIDLALR